MRVRALFIARTKRPPLKRAKKVRSVVNMAAVRYPLMRTPHFCLFLLRQKKINKLERAPLYRCGISLDFIIFVADLCSNWVPVFQFEWNYKHTFDLSLEDL